MRALDDIILINPLAQLMVMMLEVDLQVFNISVRNLICIIFSHLRTHTTPVFLQSTVFLVSLCDTWVIQLFLEMLGDDLDRGHYRTTAVHLAVIIVAKLSCSFPNLWILLVPFFSKM